MSEVKLKENMYISLKDNRIIIKKIINEINVNTKIEYEFTSLFLLFSKDGMFLKFGGEEIIRKQQKRIKNSFFYKLLPCKASIKTIEAVYKDKYAIREYLKNNFKQYILANEKANSILNQKDEILI